MSPLTQGLNYRSACDKTQQKPVKYARLALQLQIQSQMQTCESDLTIEGSNDLRQKVILILKLVTKIKISD